MNAIANIGQELEDFFAKTSDRELLQLWKECAREEYKATMTVSEYMTAIGHLVEEPIGETSSAYAVIEAFGVPILEVIPKLTHAIIGSPDCFYQLQTGTTSTETASISTSIPLVI